MIRLPLDQYSGRRHPRPDVVVELDDEYSRVHLTLELEENELGAPKTRSIDVDGALDRWKDEGRDAVLDRAGSREGRSTLPSLTTMLVDLFLLTDEVSRLRRLIEGAREIDRELMADEARALAAMLVHYAGEVERR